MKYVSSLSRTAGQHAFEVSPSPLLNPFATSEVQIQSSGLSPCGVTEQVNCRILIIVPQQKNTEREVWRCTHCV